MEQEEIIIIVLGASTDMLVATATALAHAILPYPSTLLPLPLHEIILIIISSTPRILANDLVPQIIAIAIFLLAMGIIHLGVQGVSVEANQRTPAMNVICLNLPQERRCNELILL